MGRQVCLSSVPKLWHSNYVGMLGRAVAFLDLTLLVIANSIMRTRLPPKKSLPQDGRALVRSILTDIPFIVYTAGAFLVCI